jgi:hypothetical protein
MNLVSLGNHRSRRRVILAVRRMKGRRRRCTSLVNIEPTWMSRREMHRTFARLYTQQLLPSISFFLSAFFSLLLLCFGDVEANPGPPQPPALRHHNQQFYVYFVTKIGCKSQRKLKCVSCLLTFHLKCLKLSSKEIKHYNCNDFYCW